jgi:hypothetical protein
VTCIHRHNIIHSLTINIVTQGKIDLTTRCNKHFVSFSKPRNFIAIRMLFNRQTQLFGRLFGNNVLTAFPHREQHHTPPSYHKELLFRRYYAASNLPPPLSMLSSLFVPPRTLLYWVNIILFLIIIVIISQLH